MSLIYCSHKLKNLSNQVEARAELLIEDFGTAVKLEQYYKKRTSYLRQQTLDLQLLLAALSDNQFCCNCGFQAKEIGFFREVSRPFFFITLFSLIKCSNLLSLARSWVIVCGWFFFGGGEGGLEVREKKEG